MLKITDAARDMLKEMMKEHEGHCLRLVVQGFG